MTDNNEMYREVSWMKAGDWAILTLLESSNLSLSPNNIAYNTGYSRGYISDRTRNLERRGLLEADRNGDPFFSLTDLGRAAARREVDPEIVEERTALPEDGEDSDEGEG